MSIALSKLDLAVIEESLMQTHTDTRTEFTNVSAAITKMGTELNAELSQFYSVKLWHLEVCLHQVRALKNAYHNKKTTDNTVIILADDFVQDDK